MKRDSERVPDSTHGTARSTRWPRAASELALCLRTLTSAVVYATLIVTFLFQIARVEGRSLEPTLEDEDRLMVNKLAYQLHDPRVGDIVMLPQQRDYLSRNGSRLPGVREKVARRSR